MCQMFVKHFLFTCRVCSRLHREEQRAQLPVDCTLELEPLFPGHEFVAQSAVSGEIQQTDIAGFCQLSSDSFQFQGFQASAFEFT